jgi:hypothetical protein
MMMPLCFFPCENDDPSGSFCKSLEHRRVSSDCADPRLC